MKVTEHSDEHDIAAVADDWRRLAEASGNPFLTPEWYLACTEAGFRRVFVARRAGHVAGVMGLVEARWRGLRALRFGGDALGDRLGPVCAPGEMPEAAVALGRAALEAGGPLYLANCPDEGDWAPALAAAAGCRATAITCDALPFADLRGLDWDGFLATRSRNFRQKVRRVERKLIREHGMTVHETDDPTAVGADMEALFELHDARRSGIGGTSLDSETKRAALIAFARASSERGWLRLRIMQCEERPVAAFLGWSIGGRYSFYQSGFDPSWGSVSVGQVSLALAVRAATEERATEFDLLLGEETYKSQFATGHRQVHSWLVSGRFHPASVVGLAERVARALRRARRARQLSSKRT